MASFPVPEFSSNIESQIDNIFTEKFPASQPGACVIIVKDGKICYDKGFGLAEIETSTPITDITSFNICSVSKQFTSTGILLLVQQGKLSVDDTVSKYFPNLKAPFYKDITISHLLSHTSGLPDWRPRTPEEWETYISKHPTRFKTLREFKLYCEEDESLRYLESLEKTVFKPGMAYEYQNPTYQLLGQIIEKVTGKSFDEWMNQYIFRPAEMESTCYFEPDKVIKNKARAYSQDKNGVWQYDDYGYANFFGTKADGGMYVTPLDFVKWDQALFNDKILSREMRQLAHTSKIKTDLPYT
ncbi:MAG: beta-lactamase family protein, partial [Muribaculaceae bacterium]|nr:beta-lactamase family protein [Muribaculaceae bacterium]